MLENYDEVIEAALSLPEGQRVLVADALLSSLNSPDAQFLHESWLAEIQRRSQEYDAGGIVGIPWEEVKENARRRIAGA